MKHFSGYTSRIKCILVCQLIFLSLLGFADLAHAKGGEITGFVLEEQTHKPLPYANVMVLGTRLGAFSKEDGSFIINDVPFGVHSLQASVVGYETRRVENISVNENSSVEVDFELKVKPIPLKEIIVTPGRFEIMQKEPTVQQTLTEEDIHHIPQLAEDVYRAVTRLPGVSGSDYSSKFNIRGGENEEVLVLLDGMELYEPFHLKDFGGVLSIIDTETIGGIDMMTGGFPAEYGDKLSGVFNMKSTEATLNQRRTSLGISFFNARFLTEGDFNDGKGQWLLSARRGYIDLALKLIGEKDAPSPRYYDVLGKVQYQLNRDNNLSVHILRAGDTLDFSDSGDGESADTGYGNTYGWLNWKTFVNPRLFGQTVFSVGRVGQDRLYEDLDVRENVQVSRVSDVRDFTFYGLKQDWDYELSDKHYVKWGIDVKRLTSEYNYFNRDRVFNYDPSTGFVSSYDTTQVMINPSGTELGAYFGDRFRPFGPLTAEVGIRYDYHSYTGDKELSPRINLAYAFGKRSVLRFGWGRFFQSQGINELDVQDGDDMFYPAELAEHRVIGLEHVLENGIKLRVEGYQKKLSDLRPRYLNLTNPFEAFLEIENDRVRLEPKRGQSKGVEFFVKRDTGGKISWWGSYGYAFAEDEVDGETVSKNFDQRHTAYLDFNFRPSKKWSINLAWQYHTGWPYTNVSFETETQPDGTILVNRYFGPLNAERLPAYHRMDLRINRYFDLAKGRLSIFVEVYNLYNHENVRSFDFGFYIPNDGELVNVRSIDPWLPRLPSLGVSWEL